MSSTPINTIKVEELVKSIKTLNKEEYKLLMSTVAKLNPYPSELSYITNKFQKSRRGKFDKDTTQDPDSIKLFTPGPASELKPGRLGKSSRALESSPSASLLPDIHGISAWKVPLIFRGDLVPQGGNVFIDVEKLSMKLGWSSRVKKHVQVANNIAIVDEKGTLIFWTFIKRNTNDVCQYFSKLHRITKSKVLEGIEIDVIRPMLEKCFEGNTVVGAKIADDISSLSTLAEFNENRRFSHPKTFDIQDFFKDQAGAFKLKDIVKKFFTSRSDTYQTDFHSAIDDARATLQCYLKIHELKKEDSKISNASALGITRSKKINFL